MNRSHDILFFLLSMTVCFYACGGPSRSRNPGKRFEPRLQRSLQAILNQPTLRPMTIGLKVVSLATGDTLFAHRSAGLFHPASNTKLFTAVSALRILGPDYRFLTTIFADPDLGIRGDTLSTNLYLYGRGDPFFSTDDLDRLAGTIAAFHPVVIAGDVILDDSYFDTVPLGEGWMWDDVQYGYSAQLSAMTINSNCVQVKIMPGDAVGAPVAVRISPSTAYLTFDVKATTMSAGSESIAPLRVQRHWQARRNIITITGALPLGAGERLFIRTVEEPGLYAALLLKEQLHARGVYVTGRVRRGKTPYRARALATHKSEPLTTTVTKMLKDSDNLSAELLIKTMGQHLSGETGTTRGGLRAVRHVLTEYVGLDTLSYRFADGSGLSFYNLVTPDQTIALLAAAYQDTTLRTSLMEALPIAGMDGTLKNRMKGTEAEGILRAKTGTLSGASCLSGFVYTQDGEPLVFSIMMNNYVGSSATARRAQDEIGAVLAGFSRK